MAKTISRVLPRVDSWAGQEIKYAAGTEARAGEGLTTLAGFMNAAYEDLRGALVRDMRISYDSQPILSADGEMVRYRSKLQGVSELADVARVYLWLDRSDLAGSPSAEVTVKIGASTLTAQANGGADSGGWLLDDFGTLDTEDDAEYKEVQVSISDLTDAELEIGGIFIGYDRPRSVLLESPGTEALGGYSTSLYHPLDLSWWASDYPLDVHQLRELLRNIRYLRKRAYAMIATWGEKGGSGMTLRANLTRVIGRRPPGCLQSVWHYYTPSTSGTISMATARGVSDTDTISGSGWGTLTLTHADVASQSAIDEDFYLSGETALLESLCGYWVTP